MDATRRAELDDLRRRVFGPDAATDPDPVAVDRLRALEEELHGEHPPPRPPEPPAVAALPGPSPAPRRPARDAQAPSWRHMVPTAVGAVVVVVAALAIGGTFGRPPTVTTHTVPAADARSVAADGGAVMLQRMVVLNGFDAVPLPDIDRIPAFPTDATLQWAVLVNRSHGWAVWIAGADGERGTEHCLAVTRDDAEWARCVLAERQDDDVLAVAVPHDAAGRQAGLDPGQRLGFWWSAAERAIFVLRVSAPAA